MRQARKRWHAAPTPGAPPSGGARLAGGLLLPVLTVMSAFWFASMAIAGYIVWWLYDVHALPDWSAGPEGSWPQIPLSVALIILLVVYALIAMPIGAGRRVALHYANGGRLLGWAGAWSGLLWLALVSLALYMAWWLMPQMQNLLRLELADGHLILYV